MTAAAMVVVVAVAVAASEQLVRFNLQRRAIDGESRRDVTRFFGRFVLRRHDFDLY